MSNPWSVSVPALAALAPFDPTRTRIPTGAYQVLIKNSDPHVKKDAAPGSAAGSIKLTVGVTDAGEFHGRELDIYMPLDMNKEFVQRLWKNLLLSIGAPAQALANANNLGPATFQGKTAYIYVQAAPEGEQDGDNKKGDDRKFITPEQYAKIRATVPAGALAVAPQLGAVAQPAALGLVPQPPAANGMSALGASVPSAPTASGGVQF